QEIALSTRKAAPRTCDGSRQFISSITPPLPKTTTRAFPAAPAAPPPPAAVGFSAAIATTSGPAIVLSFGGSPPHWSAPSRLVTANAFGLVSRIAIAGCPPP